MDKDGFTYNNLLIAAKQCSRGVGWKNSVVKWGENIHRYCLQLERELEEKTFKWSDTIPMTITSPKRRQVNSLRFRDRVVQRCMCNNGLYEDLTHGNIYDNGACQVGKGTSFTSKRLKVHLSRHYRHHGDKGWVLSLDIHKFFDTIPHDKLVSFVFKRVQSNRYRWMVRDLIRMGGANGVGLELGSQISQLLAVGYLSPLDYFIKHRAGVAGYVRYCDDMILLIPPRCLQPNGEYIDGKVIAAALLEAIIRVLSELGLSLNPKSATYPIGQGINFLGCKYKLTASGKVISRPLKNKTARETKKLRRMLKRGLSKEIVNDHLLSWHSHYGKCTDTQSLHKLQGVINGNNTEKKG